MVAVGERNARIAGAAGGGGDPRHHLKGNAVFGEVFDLLPAAAEDEWIATLQAQHPVALTGELHQLAVDVVLGDRVVSRGLAHIDTFGVTAHQVQYVLRYQAVVEHDVRPLHQSQGAKGEQVRIAGAAADQVDLARRLPLRAVQDSFQSRLRLPLTIGQDQFGDAAFEQVFPKGPALVLARDFFLHPGAKPRSEPGQVAKIAGQHGFEPAPQQARQHRAAAAGGDGDLHRRTIDDSGEDHRAQCRVIDHVDQDIPLPGPAGNLEVDLGIAGSRDHQGDPGHVIRVKGFAGDLDRATVRQLPERVADFRGHDLDPGAGFEQWPHLAQGGFAAAHHQAFAALQVVE